MRPHTGRGIRDAGNAIWGTSRKKWDMKNLAALIPDRTSRIKPVPRHFSNEKMAFQSFFMLMTVQLFFFASSYSAWVKVPTLVLGSPCAGP